MANKFLFISSCLISFLHIRWLIIFMPYNLVLVSTILTGLLTSIANHGLTSNYAKWSDRLVMWIGIFVNMYLLLDVEYNTRQLCYFLLSLTVTSYFLSKFLLTVMVIGRNSIHLIANILHVLAHIFITANHLILIEYFSSTNPLRYFDNTLHQ